MAENRFVDMNAAQILAGMKNDPMEESVEGMQLSSDGHSSSESDDFDDVVNSSPVRMPTPAYHALTCRPVEAAHRRSKAAGNPNRVAQRLKF